MNILQNKKNKGIRYLHTLDRRARNSYYFGYFLYMLLGLICFTFFSITYKKTSVGLLNQMKSVSYLQPNTLDNISLHIFQDQFSTFSLHYLRFRYCIFLTNLYKSYRISHLREKHLMSAFYGILYYFCKIFFILDNFFVKIIRILKIIFVYAPLLTYRSSNWLEMPINYLSNIFNLFDFLVNNNKDAFLSIVHKLNNYNINKILILKIDLIEQLTMTKLSKATFIRDSWKDIKVPADIVNLSHRSYFIDTFEELIKTHNELKSSPGNEFIEFYHGYRADQLIQALTFGVTFIDKKHVQSLSLHSLRYTNYYKSFVSVLENPFNIVFFMFNLPLLILEQIYSILLFVTDIICSSSETILDYIGIETDITNLIAVRKSIENIFTFLLTPLIKSSSILYFVRKFSLYNLLNCFMFIIDKLLNILVYLFKKGKIESFKTFIGNQSTKINLAQENIKNYVNISCIVNRYNIDKRIEFGIDNARNINSQLFKKGGEYPIVQNPIQLNLLQRVDASYCLFGTYICNIFSSILCVRPIYFINNLFQKKQLSTFQYNPIELSILQQFITPLFSLNYLVALIEKYPQIIQELIDNSMLDVKDLLNFNHKDNINCKEENKMISLMLSNLIQKINASIETTHNKTQLNNIFNAYLNFLSNSEDLTNASNHAYSEINQQLSLSFQSSYTSKNLLINPLCININDFFNTYVLEMLQKIDNTSDFLLKHNDIMNNLKINKLYTHKVLVKPLINDSSIHYNLMLQHNNKNHFYVLDHAPGFITPGETLFSPTEIGISLKNISRNNLYRLMFGLSVTGGILAN